MNEVELIQCFQTDAGRAYRELLDQYTGVMMRMIRRFFHDPDEIMEVYTSICERFQAHDYRALRRFHSNSELLPWLSVVVANACRDQFRKNRAVSMPHSVLKQLDEREHLVFQYYYQERLPYDDVVQLVRTRHGLACTALDVMEAVGRINSLLSTKKRWHLIAALNANAPAVSVEEMQEYGHELSVPPRLEGQQPDERVGRLQAALEKLDPEDQVLVLLRFEHGMTAAQIAKALDFDNHKQVYTRLRTVLNRLRRHFDEDVR